MLPAEFPVLAKLAIEGVGRSGTAGIVPLRCNPEDEKFRMVGVEGASSVAVGVESVCLRDLRLEDEKFFLSSLDPELFPRAGDAGVGGI